MRKLHLCFNTMRFRVIAFAAAAAALMAGCTDGYDDSKLVDRLDGYEKRISDLENASKQLDAQIKAGALISGVNAIEGGWRIDFTGGTTPSIEIMHGAAGKDAGPVKTPLIEVKPVGDGVYIFIDGVQQNVNLKPASGTPGSTGKPGAPGTTPTIGENGNWWIGTTDTGVKAAGDAGTTPTIGENGNWWIGTTDTGVKAAGDDGVKAFVEFRVEVVGGVKTIQYNRVPAPGAAVWEDLLPISNLGPVAMIEAKADGYIQITMNDGTDTVAATTYTFERASSAVRFEIMTFKTVTIPRAATGQVRFVVNPSTAWIPTTGDGGVDKWQLNAIGSTAAQLPTPPEQQLTRASYVNPSAIFRVVGVEPDKNDAGETLDGQYVASVLCNLHEENIDEYIVALVLNAGSTAAPVLISSSPFALDSDIDTTPPTIVNSTTTVTGGTTEPGGSVTAVETSGEIVLNFTEPMKTGVGTVTLSKAGSTPSQLTSQSLLTRAATRADGDIVLPEGKWSNEFRTYTVTYQRLEYLTQYTVTASGFQDASGNALENDFKLDFTTQAIPVIEGHGNLYIFNVEGGVKVISANADATVRETTIIAPREQLRFRYISKAATPAVNFEFGLNEPIVNEYTIPSQAAKVLIASDFHGQLGALGQFLKGNGVVDDEWNWAYGTNHLIIQGDFLDRGRDDSGIGWLLYKLEAEAKAAGGRLDFIIGNHEDIITKKSDIQYLHTEVKAFATAAGYGTTATYGNLFGADTEMGAWIRNKWLMLTMGDDRFVHGGLSTALVDASPAYTIEEINSMGKQYVGIANTTRNNADARNTILWDGSSSSTPPYRGVVWNRAMVRDDANAITSANLDRVLAHFGNAKRVFVGHTIVTEVSVRYGGRVWAVNVDHSVNYPKLSSAGVLMEGDVTYIVDYNGNKALPITSLAIDQQDVTVEKDKTVTLTTPILPAAAAGATLTWTSSKPAVATVDENGVVTALARGKTTITAAASALAGGATATTTVSVTSADGAQYYYDGDLVLIKAATRGDGINVVFVGEGFTEDMMEKVTGDYETIMRQYMDYYLMPDPIKRYADCFNLWMSVAVSNEAGISIGTTDSSSTYWYNIGTDRDTKFSVIGRPTRSDGTNGTSLGFKGVSGASYATRAATIEAWKKTAIAEIATRTGRTLGVTDVPIVMICNDPLWRGTCQLWNDAGQTISMSTLYPGIVSNRGTVAAPGGALLMWHEGGGHGFGQLYDEYEGYSTAITASATTNFNARKNSGGAANVDVSLPANPTIADTSWAQFANYPQYTATVGISEGATYRFGQWKSDIAGDKKCTMNDNRIDFDAPSRWELVKRIHRRGGLGDITFEQFVQDDTAANALATAAKTRTSVGVLLEDALPPTDPPTIHYQNY